LRREIWSRLRGWGERRGRQIGIEAGVTMRPIAEALRSLAVHSFRCTDAPGGPAQASVGRESRAPWDWRATETALANLASGDAAQCVVKRRPDGWFDFAHRSFHDYFLAESILDVLRARSPDLSEASRESMLWARYPQAPSAAWQHAWILAAEAWSGAVDRVARMAHRSQRRQPSHNAVAALARRLQEHCTPPLEAAVQMETVSLVKAAIAKLPPLEKQVLVLKYFEGKSLSEISKTIEKPISTVWRLKRRAGELLLDHLRGHFPELAAPSRRKPKPAGDPPPGDPSS
jgi:RNA polymerase sigma factor (sigma-70 family)